MCVCVRSCDSGSPGPHDHQRVRDVCMGGESGGQLGGPTRRPDLLQVQRGSHHCRHTNGRQAIVRVCMYVCMYVYVYVCM